MGIKSLLAGTIHPAAYVFLGNAINIKNAFGSFHFDSEINIKPIHIYNQTMQYFTSENVAKTLTNVGEQFMHIDLGSFSSSIKSSFFDQCFEWESAAAWGATTTIAHMALKKVPVIKHHEYLRLSLATAIGAATTIAGYQYGLEQDIPINHFLEIAYKVALIGIPLKVLNLGGQVGLNLTHASAEKIASIVKGSCALGLATLKFFEWKGPEKIRPPAPAQRVPDPADDLPSDREPAAAKGKGRGRDGLRRAATAPPRSAPQPDSPSPSPERKTQSESSDSE